MKVADNLGIKITEIIKNLEVNKTTVYKDIKFLEIETIKDAEGSSYLSEEDYERLLKLREHIEETGSRKGFTEELGGELIVRENNNKLQRNKPNYEDIYVEPEEPTEPFEDEFMREAMELKAREIAMPDLVKRALADQIQEEDLPEDLKEKITNVREASNPKFTAQDVATRLLSNYKRKSLT